MDFGDDFVSAAPNAEDDVDPAAEFLVREKSMLGDLEAEINAVSTLTSNGGMATAAAISVPADDVGLLGGDIPEQTTVNSGGFNSSTGSFEIISGENNDGIGMTGQQPAVARIEPEKIRKWREEQKKRLEEKDREEELKKEELRQQAKKELEDWLRQTEESIAKTKAAARSAEKQAAALVKDGAMEQGTEWECIAKLCDFNPKVNKSGKDLSRMRSIYLHLKQSPIPVKAQKT